MDEIELQAGHDFHAKLLQLLPPSVAEVKVEEFAGVRVKSSAISGPRSCITACSRYVIQSQGNYKPGFQTSFEENGARLAFGTTASMADTASAVAQWLQGVHLDKLYDQFGFIDKSKRYLTGLREAVRSEIPCLEDSVQVELKEDRGVWFGLRFQAANRSVNVEGYLKIARFFWDQCVMFQFEVRNPVEFASVLNRWLCENALPSSMRNHFPWLEIGRLADFYEAGNPIEGEFLQSWDETEAWVNGPYFAKGTPVPRLIAELRTAGYDRKLRVGMNHGRGPIFSRSRRPVLRDDQADILVDCLPGEEFMDMWVTLPEQSRGTDTSEGNKASAAKKITGVPAALSGQFAEAIDQLCEAEID